MKSLGNRLGGWVLGFFLLGSCQEHDAPVSQPPAQHAAPSAPVSPPSAAVERADFGGVWLNAEYAARLRQTRSPRRADGHWGPSGVTLVLIDPGSYQGDSLRVAMGYGNHEGGPPHYLHLRPGYAGTLLPATADPSLGLAPLGFRYRVQGPDTVL